MAAEKLTFVLLPGRIISGSLTDKQTTDWEGKPIPPEDQSYTIGVAVPKSQPGINELLGSIYNHTGAAYQKVAGAQAVLQQIGQGFDAPDFAWKIKDGDKPNKRGEIGEHGKGCFVFYFSSKYPIKTVNNLNAEIDPKEVKRGYYVDVAASTSINESTGRTAGIYLNPNIVRLLGYGPEITGGVSADVAFANTPAALPPGASALPIAPTGSGQPGGGGFGTPGALPGAAPATGGLPAGGFGGAPAALPAGGFGGAPAALPGTAAPGVTPGVTPHYGFVAGAPAGNGFPGT